MERGLHERGRWGMRARLIGGDACDACRHHFVNEEWCAILTATTARHICADRRVVSCFLFIYVTIISPSWCTCRVCGLWHMSVHADTLAPKAGLHGLCVRASFMCECVVIPVVVVVACVYVCVEVVVVAMVASVCMYVCFFCVCARAYVQSRVWL